MRAQLLRMVGWMGPRPTVPGTPCATGTWRCYAVRPTVGERRNPYHVLGLKKGATEVEIKEAYKVLARKHHPDRNQNDPGARERFIEVQEAYEALIERKTAAPILAQVEETNAEFVRSGAYRKVAIRVAAAVVALAALGLGFAFRDELDFRMRDFLARRADPEGAVEWLRPVMDGGNPRAAHVRVGLARRLLAANDRAGAEALLSDAADPLGRAMLGDLHVASGRLDDARRAYERAIAASQEAETWARAYAGLVSVDDAAAATKVYSDAAAKFPQDPWVRWMTALRDLRAGRPHEAAVRVDGVEMPAARSMRAAALVTAARLLEPGVRWNEERRRLSEDAIRELEQGAPAGTPGEFGMLRPVPQLLRQRLTDWTPTTSLDDATGAWHLARAAAELERRSKEGDLLAVAAAERARARDERSLSALLGHGAVLLRLSAAEAGPPARNLFSAALGMYEGSATAWAGVALAISKSRPDPLVNAEDYAHELTAWEKAIGLEPQNAEWHHGRALSLRRAGPARMADRIESNRRAIVLDPAYGAPRLDLADALEEQGRDADAIAVLQAATKVPEVGTLAWMRLADHHYVARRFHAAAGAYRSAALDPDPDVQAAAWLGAARSWAHLRKPQEAFEAMDRATSLALDLKPDHNDPAIAWIFSKGWRPDAGPLDTGVATLLREADGHYTAGRFIEAASSYRRATDEGLDVAVRARGWYGVARSLAMSDQFHRSSQAMRRAVELDPSVADLRDPVFARLEAAGFEPLAMARGMEP